MLSYLLLLVLLVLLNKNYCITFEDNINIEKYNISSNTDTSSSSSSTAEGKVVVSEGNTLKVHTSPTINSNVINNLNNNAIITINCITIGDTITGSQGTTNNWYQINSNGYASAAYIIASTIPSKCTNIKSTFELALNYGMNNINTIYVGCAGGDYRFGIPAPYDMYHDGTSCGQSRVYFQKKGSIGFDCSGLMVEMFKAAGITLPYTSSTLIKENVPEVSKNDIQKGDMLAKSGHVVMWIGNNQVIESTPYTQSSDTTWEGTRINTATSYMNSIDYTAHRYPGLY
jgi:cell wall-associated NlpC family hydrolase